MTKPHISIIIPTYKRADKVGITLDSFLRQSYPEDRCEIIVVDNNSPDHTKQVIEKSRRQQLLIMVLLIIVSAVIIALIIYTLTMDKVRSIATLKFVGAPDRTIVGLIVQQALSMGLMSYAIGLGLVVTFQPYFPRRLVLDPESIAVVFLITVVMCLAASTLGIRLALKVDPAEALSAAG